MHEIGNRNYVLKNCVHRQDDEAICMYLKEILEKNKYKLTSCVINVLVCL